MFDIFYIIIGIPCLFMTIATSRSYTTLKTILLLLLVIIAITEIFVRKIGISKNNMLYILIFIMFCFFSLKFGIISGFKFDLKVDFGLLQYYIFTPIIILILSSIFKYNYERRDYLIKTLEIITFIVIFLDLYKILSYRIGLPDIDFFNLITISNNDITNNLALRVSNEGNLMFLLPFVIVLFFENSNKRKKILRGITMIMGILYSILSGRKMLELLVIFTFCLMILKIFRSLNRKEMKNIFRLGLIIILFFLILTYISPLIGVNIIEKSISTIINGLSSDNYGVIKRVDNTKALLDLWLSSPIFGNGLNSYAVNSLASYTTYWSYEVYYFALLAQIGCFGIGILFYGICYIERKLYINYKKGKYNNYEILAIMVAFTCFIFASASNPLFYLFWPWTISLIYSY